MPETQLTAIAIKKAGDGKQLDSGGLLRAKKGDRGTWVYRNGRLGQRPELGLGLSHRSRWLKPDPRATHVPTPVAATTWQKSPRFGKGSSAEPSATTACGGSF